MTTRTDIHCPSAIQPLDYVFIAVGHQKINDLDGYRMLATHHKILEDHRKETGATYSQHEHGGACHVCGAHCLYTAIYYHPATNVYIKMGFDCADKMDMGDAKLFRAVKRDVKLGNALKAGKKKAQLFFDAEGCPEVWDIFNWSTEQYAASGMNPAGEWCYMTLTDIVGKQVRWGSISPRQLSFVKELAVKCLAFAEIKAEKDAIEAAEREASDPVPVTSERMTFEGVILHTKYDEYWDTHKMVFQDYRGFKLWGTVPSAVNLDGCKGKEIKFDAKVEVSDKDEYFGFFKRPSKVSGASTESVVV